MLLVFLMAMVGSWIPLLFIPFGTGAWFLMGLLAGGITAWIGAGLVALSAMSDNVGFSYYVWWLVALVLALGGGGLLIWSAAMLIWRGAGLQIDVQVVQ